MASTNGASKKAQPAKSPIKYKNEILRRLDPEIIERLELHPIDLPVNHEIEFPGQSIDHLFFVEGGIASMTATFEDGVQVEIALAGHESVLGSSSMMGTKHSLNRVYMQVGGHGFTSRTGTATREFKRGEQFHDLTLRYLQAQFLQSAQTAGCNARHSVDQRLARWLLLVADRFGSGVIPLRQEFMGDMLGVTRSSVTLTAGKFQDLKLIRYSRGKLEITDVAGLEKLACECYRVVRDHLAGYMDTDEGFGL